jgi:hypothetical protein
MASALDVNMVHAATWKGAQAAPPAAPNPLNVTSGYCWGFNSVQWAAQSGAVEYRLFRSYSSGFTNPTLIYSGPGIATGVNVSQSAYLRAKACNSGGCSPYSAQVAADYFPGCM